MKRDAFTMEPGSKPAAAPRGVAIFLCNLTMNMAAPWLAAGFRVVLVDPRHVASSEHGLVERIAGTVIDAMPRLSQMIWTERVVFVFGFPPCTDVAVSGSRWYEKKRLADSQFQAKAALVAEQCRMVGLSAGCAWGFENPVSVFNSIFRRPSHTFNPHDFTMLCADDNYTKKTCLWKGGGLRDAGASARQLTRHAGQPNSRRASRTRPRQLPQRYASRFLTRSLSCQRSARDCEGGVIYLLLTRDRGAIRGLHVGGGGRHELNGNLQRVYVGANEFSRTFSVSIVSYCVAQEAGSRGNHAMHPCQLFCTIARKCYEVRNFLHSPKFQGGECAPNLLRPRSINVREGFTVAYFCERLAYVLADMPHVENPGMNRGRINSCDSQILGVPLSRLVCGEPNGSNQGSGRANRTYPVGPFGLIQIRGESGAYQKDEAVNSNARNIERKFHCVVESYLKACVHNIRWIAVRIEAAILANFTHEREIERIA